MAKKCPFCDVHPGKNWLKHCWSHGKKKYSDWLKKQPRHPKKSTSIKHDKTSKYCSECGKKL